jgi:acetylornithine deacetylase/succinyl-diaminopimelate desuccinylase-like protein
MNTISQSNKIKKTYISLLREFVSFKTVSTDPAFKKDIQNAVAWLSSLFKSKGFEVSLLKGKNTNPVICAKYTVDKKAKTVLVYGHYDVQPAHKSDGWKTDPFSLVKNKDRYISRGVVDNKGQILAHMVGAFNALEQKTLAHNVVFLIEGNEESGNDDLLGLLKKHRKHLSPDFILISDGEIVGQHPALDMSYRGGGNIKLTYKTSDNDRHSGLYGGVIPNAVFELATLVSKLKLNNGVNFADFYVGVSEASVEVQQQHKKLSKIQNLQKLAGVKTLLTEKGISPHEQIGLKPTIEISGFSGGYTGGGFKNIVPGSAEVRINVRTVHPQNTDKIMSSIEKFISKNTPSYVDFEIEVENHGNPIYLDTNHEDLSDVKSLLADIYRKEVLCRSVGASIPVVAELQEVFNVPIAMVSLCNDDCNMHGVNENFSEEHIVKALNFTNRYWNNLTT